MKPPKYGVVIEYTKTLKGTSIGRRPITSTMNKNKRRQLGKKPIYRGQGKWKQEILKPKV